jgi:hypothetical protein
MRAVYLSLLTVALLPQAWAQGQIAVANAYPVEGFTPQCLTRTA